MCIDIDGHYSDGSFYFGIFGYMRFWFIYKIKKKQVKNPSI